MQRRDFLTKAAASAATGGAILGAPAVIGQAPAVRWRLTSAFPKSLDTIYGAAEVFAQEVSKATGGKFQISVHAAGEIVPTPGLVDAVQNGTVEAGHTAPYYYFGKDETFALGCAIPFGLNSRQMSAWMFEGNGLKLMREFYAKYNMINFPGGNTGAQMGGWYRKEIKTAADLKGLKFRVGGFAGKVCERMGMVPQNIPGGEIYQALEKGTIDAAEWVGPYDDQKLGFNKVAPNYYYPGWWEGASVGSLYVNNEAWAKLPKAYQSMIEAASGRVTSWMVPKYDAGNPPALRRLVAAGTELRPFPRAVLEPCFLEAYKYYDELSAKDPKFKKIYDNLKAFRADENLWFRVAENTFDNFNFSMSAQGR